MLYTNHHASAPHQFALGSAEQSFCEALEDDDVEIADPVDIHQGAVDTGDMPMGDVPMGSFLPLTDSPQTALAGDEGDGYSDVTLAAESDESWAALNAEFLDQQPTSSAVVVQYTAALKDNIGSPTFGISGQPFVGEPLWLNSVPTGRNGPSVHVNLTNPFEDTRENHIRELPRRSMPLNGPVDGYVKFRYSRNQPAFAASPLQPMPPLFGLGCSLNGKEQKLFEFYLTAWCKGRTIIPKSNLWRSHFAQMFTQSPPLRHAILALAAIYVLDYVPTERIRGYANENYERAVRLLSEAMQDPNSQGVGRGDDIIAAICCLNMIDAVAWEFRRPRDQVPRWLEGGRQACKLLDASDPGQRYTRAENVQMNLSRMSDIIVIGRCTVVGLFMSPLDSKNTKGQFRWLVRGRSYESNEIHGILGFSPKLLYIFSEITHLAAKMFESPNEDVFVAAGLTINENLDALRQWTHESLGYSNTEELLRSCRLNDEGVIECRVKMTDLGAQAWRIAAQIYLLCRFFRLSRNHPEVCIKATELLDCIIRMPCSGPLFTSQAPFFPIFLLGIISVTARGREVVRDWFERSASPCRSSLPPAFTALKRLWVRFDAGELDDADEPAPRVSDRNPWWEDMVAHTIRADGILCLF